MKNLGLIVDVIIMTSLIFPSFTKMLSVRKINTLLNFPDTTNTMEQKNFPIKAGLVVDWVRLFDRLIILELRNVFPAVALGALLELLKKIEEIETLVLSLEDFPQTHRT